MLFSVIFSLKIKQNEVFHIIFSIAKKTYFCLNVNQPNKQEKLAFDIATELT